ncbi:MAG TPA: Ppx/GppA phosphatase family protein [Bacteroidota bacterium]|nr:Ppx/GppA phosphatase family protein [Bacteroidota bacterium]
MTVAVIDIGTNTILLLVATVSPDGTIQPLVYEQRIPRLGQGVDARRRLHPDSMQRAVDVLIEYREMIRQFSPARTAVIGTSAIRDAENRQAFADLVSSRTGFTLEVLSGEEEAALTYRGAISGIPGIQRATVVDIGGGSTEITAGAAGMITSSCSLNIGSVRLTERFVRSDPPRREELDSLSSCIDEALDAVHPTPDASSTLVAVAGTATTLALLAKGYTEFSLGAVSGATLEAQEVFSVAQNLSGMSVSDILQRGSYMPGRADVITAGAFILRAIMRRFGFPRVIVSERGVRYGVALRESER